MTNLELGYFGEKMATEYLRKQGYVLIGRNIRTRCGELDIIMKDKGVLVAIEVKTRRSRQYCLPCEAVNRTKQRHIRQSMALYLARYGNHQMEVRFDVVEVYVLGDVVTHIQHLRGCF